MANTYENYLQTPKSLTFDQMRELHQKLLKEIENDQSQDNLFGQAGQVTQAIQSSQASQSAKSTLTFRSDSLREEHFEKHGIEMGFASAKEYEKAAVAVVSDSRALHKLEKEDGDGVF